MELLPNDDDWSCFLDHDAMLTTHNWYVQIEFIVKKYPQYGLFACNTNRISNGAQATKDVDRFNHDIFYSRIIGKKLQQKYYDNVTEMPRAISGVLMLTNKAVWKKTQGFRDGSLGVDSDYDGQVREIAGYQTGLMEGVYVYHWYRAKLDTLKP